MDNLYWDGVILEFTGQNGRLLYSLIKQELVSWEFFSDATLSRFDINFSRKNRGSDKTTVEDFFEDCHRRVRKTNKNISFEKKSGGLSLKIGHRKSNQCFRIYESREQNSIKVEYEIKVQYIQDYQSLLVSNSFEEFEDKLSKRFLDYSGKLLPLYHSQVNWLAVKLRPMRQQQFSTIALKSHYLRRMDFPTQVDRKRFFTLLRFLVFTKLT